MRSKTTDTLARWLSALLVAGTVAMWPAAGAAQGFRWPAEPENLQVLPDSIRGPRLGAVMRGFASALGVRCNHCHVGEGNDLSAYEFPRDDKNTKRIARVMIEMVQRINSDDLEKLTSLGRSREQRIEVSCMTCHRGVPRPVMIEDVVAQVIDSAGIDAATARYQTLREANYGGFAYDFTAGPLLHLGEQLSGRGKTSEAIRIVELAIELNGESANALFTLGNIQANAGDRHGAIDTFERGKELAPADFKRFFQMRIDRLRQP